MKGLSILGSTGSIGTNVLRVVEAFPGRFEVVGLAAGGNVEVLAEQVVRHRPRIVSVADPGALERLSRLVDLSGLRAVVGRKGMVEVATRPEVRMVVASAVGAVGLVPTYRALEAGKDVALANKETLVMAGELMLARARETGARLLPIDSEHCALHECLDGRRPDDVRRLILTASGGPFRDRPLESLARVTREEALAHPTWRMGPKITIDSATLMNKGLEVIDRWVVESALEEAGSGQSGAWPPSNPPGGHARVSAGVDPVCVGLAWARTAAYPLPRGLMLALLIALVLAPPSEPARVTKPGSTTRLFDTRDSARACVDAMAADLKAELDANHAAGSRRPAPTTKGTADEICDAGTLVKLAPLTRLSLVRTEDAYTLVRVVAGKNTAKQGWTRTADLANSIAEAAAEQEQQPQQADAAVAAREQQEAQARTEPEEEATAVRKIYSDTKESLRQACGEAFGQGAKLRYILAQAPTDGPRLDAYIKALEEQSNCLVMVANGGDTMAIEAARQLLGMIPPMSAR